MLYETIEVVFGTRAFCVLLLCLPLLGQVFPTGDPVMPPSSGAMPLLTPAKYQKLAASVEGHNNFKVIHKLPPNLSPNYRIGINFTYGGANHSWILDRDFDGYKLFLDLKGDGDLRGRQSHSVSTRRTAYAALMSL